MLMPSQLYQSFARPLRLYEPILLILKTADTRIEDVCEAVWRQLLRDYRGMPPHVAISEAITNLCRRYFPSEAAPLGESTVRQSPELLLNRRNRYRLAGGVYRGGAAR